MRCKLTVLGTGLLLLLSITACSTPATEPTVTETESSSSVTASLATYEGIVQPLGPSIYMQGTHLLVTGGAMPVLLESEALPLDEYVGATVRVRGRAQATVEAGGVIVNVLTIERLSTEEASSVPEEIEEIEEINEIEDVSSQAPISSARGISSPQPTPPAPPPSSSPPSQPPPPSEGTSNSATVTLMQRDRIEASQFTVQYCSPHIGFCIPLHRNWYYQSFGTNVPPSLWHVEISGARVENVGEGVIILTLVSGAMDATSQEGIAVVQGEFAVAERQWTGNRHFRISAPASLSAAVEYVAQHLTVSGGQ